MVLACLTGALLAATVPARARAETRRAEDDCAPAEQTETPSGTTAQSPSADAAPAGPEADPPPATAAESMGRTAVRVKCLDQTLVDEFGRARSRKGVQPRYFRKALRLAVSATGGLYAGDLLDTQWQGGGNLAFWFTEGFGIDADFKVTPMTLRLERSATAVTGEDRYPDGIADNLAYVLMGHLLWAPLHTKLRARKDRVFHGDFVLFAGAGPIFHDSNQGVGFDLGVSFYLYLARFVSLRFDLSDQIVGQEAIGSRRISNNLVFSTGIGLWIPFRLKG